MARRGEREGKKVDGGEKRVRRRKKVFNPLRARVGPMGPTLFQRLEARQAVVLKI